MYKLVHIPKDAAYEFDSYDDAYDRGEQAVALSDGKLELTEDDEGVLYLESTDAEPDEED